MVPSLVDLCIKKWIDNVGILANVGETDEYLLELMLPLCSVDQLKYVEGSTKGRDLSPVTDKLWKAFYEKRFGNSDGVIEKMRRNQVSFKWKQAYEYKEEEINAREQMRRLVLEEYENDRRLFTTPPVLNVGHNWGVDRVPRDCGAGYIGSNSTAREEIDSFNSQEEEQEDDDDDYYNGDDDELEDEETDVEEEVVEIVGGEGYVEVEEVEEVEEEEEETQIEEVIEEVEEEEEQTQIEEGEDDRDVSEVGQEDGCDDVCDDGSYGDGYYGYGYGDYSCGCDDDYGDDYGFDDDDYGCDYDGYDYYY